MISRTARHSSESRSTCLETAVASFMGTAVKRSFQDPMTHPVDPFRPSWTAWLASCRQKAASSALARLDLTKYPGSMNPTVNSLNLVAMCSSIASLRNAPMSPSFSPVNDTPRSGRMD